MKYEKHARDRLSIRRLVWFFVLIFTAVIAYLFKDYLSDNIFTPIIIIFQIGMVIFQVTPHMFWWGMMIVILFFLFLKFFPYIKHSIVETTKFEEENTSRLKFWVNWISKSEEGAYANWFLSSQIAILVVDSIAYRLRSTPDQIKRSLRNGIINLPREFEQFIKDGLRAPVLHYNRNLLSRIGRQKKGLLSREVLRMIIEYLGTEIGSGG